MLAADYPFLDLMWTMLVFFLWIMWFFLLFKVIADIFRSHDMGGWSKALWLIFVLVVPFLGVFVYVITQNVGMTERNLERLARAARPVRRLRARRPRGGGGAAAEIEKAKQLLDSRRDHAGRVRGDQAEGAGVERHRGGATKEEIGPALPDLVGRTPSA